MQHLQLHIYIICIIIGQTIALPYFRRHERQRREIDILTDGNTGLVSRDEENGNNPEGIVLAIITETNDAAQTRDVLVVDERDIGYDDMEVAETHIFRPLFRYRAQLEKRQRVRKSQ